MKDLHTIIRAVETNPELARSAALATLVKVTGSYFRQPGARMLITGDGDTIGSISGGCLEDELVKQALELIRKRETALLHFSTVRPDQKSGESIRGCGGEVEILVEPLEKGRLNDLAKCVTRSARDRGACILATVFRVVGKIEAKVGDRLIVCGDEIRSADMTGTFLLDALKQDAGEVARNSRSVTREYVRGDSLAEVFIERLQLPTSVLIIGAGEVAVSLAAIATALGWQTTVVDHRASLIDPDLFPQSQCIALQEPAELTRKAELESFDAAVVLTHICEADLEYLNQLLQVSLAYLGLLGSRGRTSGLLQMLRTQTPSMDEASLARVYGPIGLDLGADDPSCIALSIVSEIQSVLAGGSAESLRDKTVPSG